MNRYSVRTRASLFVLAALGAGTGPSLHAEPITDAGAPLSAPIAQAPSQRGGDARAMPLGPLPDGRTIASLHAGPPAAEPPAPAIAPVELNVPPAALMAQVDPILPPAPATEDAAAQTADLPPAPPAAADDGKTSADAPAPASGEETESLRDAIIAALKGNPDIQIALAKQDDAKYAVNEARAAYLPHLDMSVGYGPEITRQSGNSGEWNDRLEGTVTLSQNIWDFGITINDIKRARASYRSAQWATREQIEGIAFAITNSYLGMLQQQKLIDLTHEELAATQKILRMITVQKDLGLTTQADVDRAKARVDNLQSTLLDRQSLLQQAREAYRRLTDHIPGKAVDLPGTERLLPESAETAVAMIDDHSPRMAQAVQDRRSLAKQYASQSGTFFPRVGLQVQGNHKYDVMGRTGLVQDARAMVTLSYNFLNGGADAALRNRIGARIRQADYELERRRREVAQDIRIDFQSLTAARQKIATIASEIDSAQRVADLYRQQFREGKRSVFDLLDSQQVLFGARTNEVANKVAMQLAEYRVLQKLGGLFDLVSGSEPLPPLVVPAGEADDE